MWLLIVWALWNMRRDSRDEKLVRRSLDWPETQGKIIGSKVSWAHVEVSYEYHADGVRYPGSYQINLRPVVGSSTGTGATAMAREYSRESNEALREFYPGKSIVIRYNPKKPSESLFYCAGEVSKSDQKQGDGVEPKFLVLT